MSNKVEKKRINGMPICTLTIKTRIDGQERVQRHAGRIELTNGELSLSYREENARIALQIRKGEGRMQRRGDYDLQLLFQEGVATEGSLCVGRNAGELRLFTHKVDYTLCAAGANIELFYDLLFGEEKQEMRLSITVQTKEELR